uniref:Cuticular protein 41 n=1 Tax=Leptinotarsa decemlineata TaxID=7539 RepID=A0A3S7SJN0_LEPDE|nr:cuticular protein 41 [Leptinotarsa decemlineata]
MKHQLKEQFLFQVLCALVALCAAAPQYKPFKYNKTPQIVQYRPANSNPASNDEGQYRPDDSGAYVHIDNPYNYKNIASGAYVSDNSGAYNDDGQYHPDNSGAYIPDGSGRYEHSDEGYQHQGADYNPYVGNVNRGASPSPVSIYKPVTAAPSLVAKGNSAGNKDYNKYGIIRKIEQVLEDGYHYIYETENGILGEEEGHLANKGQEGEYMDVKGFYRYIGPDNVEYKVEYTVDPENGFVPRGAHIPQLPQPSA